MVWRTFADMPRLADPEPAAAAFRHVPTARELRRVPFPTTAWLCAAARSSPRRTSSAPTSASATGASQPSANGWRAAQASTPAAFWSCPTAWTRIATSGSSAPKGGTDKEGFVTGSTPAQAGGTTTAISFAMPFKGVRLLETLAEYRRRAASAMIDHGFHQIITDATETVAREDIPRVVAFVVMHRPHRPNKVRVRTILTNSLREGRKVLIACSTIPSFLVTAHPPRA